MTEFTDLFSHQVKESGEVMLENLEEFDRKDTYQSLREEIEKMIIRSPEDEMDSPQVIAADAGRNSVSLRNNQHFYVTQAAAVDSGNNNSRSLRTGIARPFNSRAFSRLKSHASELCELRAINERIEEADTDTRTYILIDGSLMTRMMPTPRKLEISSDSDIVLELVNEFSRLLNKVMNDGNLVLAGVSKDSNSSLLNRAVIERNEQMTLQEMTEEESESAEIHRQGVPDTALIDHERNGYTQPVMMGAARRQFRNRIQNFIEEPEEYVEKHFEESDDAEETLENITDYPGIVSFYWLPGGDQPLRVDLLSNRWTGDSLLEIEDRNFVEQKPVVEEIVELLKTGYAGRERHNIWISMADSQASLSRSEIENIYLPIMSKKLGINLREYRRRRDRRV